MVSKDSVWSEQNLIWRYGFRPFHGPGPGQWCGPSSFLAVCTLMIRVYHNLCHGVTFIGAWACDAFTLSVVLYVVDSNLFHMAIRTPSDEEFLQLVQSATNAWEGLVQATGGLLKPQKCFWYMLGWIWKRGRHVSRLCMSCHRIHYINLSRTEQES
jgi:hypothetical protein